MNSMNQKSDFVRVNGIRLHYPNWLSLDTMTAVCRIRIRDGPLVQQQMVHTGFTCR